VGFYLMSGTEKIQGISDVLNADIATIQSHDILTLAQAGNFIKGIR
tara:strand:+ start:571 stop:708 length:138 start_codon:yes stop_codon:yes gene_type:complete